MLFSQDIPPAGDLRKIREHLGLSQAELSGALGFSPSRGPRTVRSWEEDEGFYPTPLAWNALRYMLMVVELYREMDRESPAYSKIARLLPEQLR